MLPIYSYLWRWSLFYLGLYGVVVYLQTESNDNQGLDINHYFGIYLFFWFYLTIPIYLFLLFLELTRETFLRPKIHFEAEKSPDNTEQKLECQPAPREGKY